jgi:hypothetical protein
MRLDRQDLISSLSPVSVRLFLTVVTQEGSHRNDFPIGRPTNISAVRRAAATPDEAAMIGTDDLTNTIRTMTATSTIVAMSEPTGISMPDLFFGSEWVDTKEALDRGLRANRRGGFFAARFEAPERVNRRSEDSLDGDSPVRSFNESNAVTQATTLTTVTSAPPA